MLESEFQKQLIQDIKMLLPECIVTKMDTSHRQGVPDLIVLYGNRWGVLEVKKHAKASRQPNQEYYVNLMGEMSFAAFIYPENKEEILDALCRSLRS